MPRKAIIIIHPETKEEMTIEQAAAKVGITPGAMRRRLSDPTWSLRKALTQKGDWNRSKNAKSRKPPAFVTTILLPTSLLPKGISANALLKKKLNQENPSLEFEFDCEQTKQVRIALNDDERDHLHRLMLIHKISSASTAIACLLASKE